MRPLQGRVTELDSVHLAQRSELCGFYLWEKCGSGVVSGRAASGTRPACPCHSVPSAPGMAAPAQPPEAAKSSASWRICLFLETSFTVSELDHTGRSPESYPERLLRGEGPWGSRPGGGRDRPLLGCHTQLPLQVHFVSPTCLSRREGGRPSCLPRSACRSGRAGHGPLVLQRVFSTVRCSQCCSLFIGNKRAKLCWKSQGKLMSFAGCLCR